MSEAGADGWFLAWFPWLFSAVAAAVVLTFAVHAWRRAKAGTLLRRDLPGTVFLETWCSFRMGVVGGNNCVWIALTDRALHVEGHFPFNVAMESGLSPFRLPTSIPLEDIRDIELLTGLLGRRVVIRFREKGRGDERKLVLFLRRAEELAQLLKKG